MCSAQHAIRFAARPLATQFCHPLGRGEDTTVGESQSAVDFFRRTDSVSSQAADAVVASESASALVSGRFVSLFLYLNLDPPTGCQHLGACDFDLGFWCGRRVAAGLPSFSCVLLSFPRFSGDFRTIPAITGAEVSVLIVAARGESPLRSSCLPAILVCP